MELPITYYRMKRGLVLWALRQLGIYHCIYCHVLTPYVGNNDEHGNVWCERCANSGLAAEDARRARQQEQEWQLFNDLERERLQNQEVCMDKTHWS